MLCRLGLDEDNLQVCATRVYSRVIPYLCDCWEGGVGVGVGGHMWGCVSTCGRWALLSAQCDDEVVGGFFGKGVRSGL